MIYQFRVAGVTAENRQKILKALYNHPMLNSSVLCFDLVPEPENPYDPNAVAVYIGQKYIIGYVPKGNVIQQKVKDGVQFDVSGTIVGGYDNKNYGVILKCKTNNDNEGVEVKSVK